MDSVIVGKQDFHAVFSIKLFQGSTGGGGLESIADSSNSGI